MYRSVTERDRAKAEFEKLMKDKRPAVRLLYEQLSDFIQTVVQDDLCIQEKKHDNRLHDMLCDFSFMYLPIPLASHLTHHGSLVNNKSILAKGSNGRVYQSGMFQDNPIVTKTKKKWSENTIYEVYLNFVVLNSFLLHNYKDHLVSHLIPSYGIFMCGSNEDGTQICHGDVKGSHLFLVQKQVLGKTLTDRLALPCDLSHFKTILTQLISVMLTLESSPYRMYHMDLHASNIIMSTQDGKEVPVVIDFELASWTSHERNGTPHRYRLNSVENKYCQKKIIYSGAYDIVLLLSSCAHAAKKANPDITDYSMSVLTRLFNGRFWKDNEKEFDVKLELFKKHSDRWLYQLLRNAEQQSTHQDLVHAHNVACIEQMNWTWISTFIGS